MDKTTAPIQSNGIFTEPDHLYGGCPEGYSPFVFARHLRDRPNAIGCYLLRNEWTLNTLKEVYGFLLPGWTILTLPPWDCLPYDRLSPKKEIMGTRLRALIDLAGLEPHTPALILTTIEALHQYLPPKDIVQSLTWSACRGGAFSYDAFTAYVQAAGYTRVSTVREVGEYAIRGDIVDLFPPGSPMPYRLDIWGDVIESMRLFDPLSQCTEGAAEDLTLYPAGEVVLTPDSVRLFRSRYRAHFGAGADLDPIYTAISDHRPVMGMEHWLPFFYDTMDWLGDYLPPRPLVVGYDTLCTQKSAERLTLIQDYYKARQEGLQTKSLGPLYRPIAPEMLYLSPAVVENAIGRHFAAHQGTLIGFSPFQNDSSRDSVDASMITPFAVMHKKGPDDGAPLFDAIADRIEMYQQAGKVVVMAFVSAASETRLTTALARRGYGTRPLTTYGDLEEVCNQGSVATKKTLFVTRLPFDQGFNGPGFVILTEEEMMGQHKNHKALSKKRSDLFIAEASALTKGDLVVHDIHGIGRYDGIETLSVGGISHDCLRIDYDGNDRLLVPVQNLDLISRYGGDCQSVSLDKMGSAAFQNRRARLKKRLDDMADGLIGLAAMRAIQKAPLALAPPELYDGFCARFPYVETDDQLGAIQDVLLDLQKGCPMDRLVCGDVGFGKTEVALRAAFAVASSGFQVAVVAPTTLLCRQHVQTFRKRFLDFGLKVGHLSRLAGAKESQDTKDGLQDGSVSIVVGTHALLSKNITFNKLGLVIVDEEQHFGVKQKERLKDLGHESHLLTLTATPIPRTLQMALAGVRDLSLIATPPVDRLAVHTFVLPYDPIVIQEAMAREYNRGGQMFYVCPHIDDLAGVRGQIQTLMPHLRIAEAHGGMAPSHLDTVMTQFCDGHYDLLLATNIIESGLDIRNAGTIFIHRADRFGLAQLYQLKGRVGRSANRGYAYFTFPVDQVLSTDGEKRLSVMQTLDTLGAGFSLASHDMDIRGAGNLLGSEQSGHMREVGVELYQQMLEDAVQQARIRQQSGDLQDGTIPYSAPSFSPQLNFGLSFLIPETYISDLGVRLAFYRRLAHMDDEGSLAHLEGELIDRFGPVPPETRNLLDIMSLKIMCKRTWVSKIDGGERGITFSFHNNHFPDPDRLLTWIMEKKGTIRLKADHKMVRLGHFPTPQSQVDGAKETLLALDTLISPLHSPSPGG